MSERVRSTDLLIRDFVIEMNKCGVNPKDDDIQRIKNTFAYAAADFHDAVIDFCRAWVGKPPVPRIYRK